MSDDRRDLADRLDEMAEDFEAVAANREMRGDERTDAAQSASNFHAAASMLRADADLAAERDAAVAEAQRLREGIEQAMALLALSSSKTVTSESAINELAALLAEQPETETTQQETL